MDIREYISSGILELYVAGALDPELMREVEDLAALHPEIRAEIRAIEEAVIALARTDRNPRPELRSTIISTIAGLEGDGAPVTAVTAVDGQAAGAPPAMRYLLVAALALTVLSSALAIYYWMQWQRAQMELVNSQERQQRTLNEVVAYKARYEGTSSELAVLRDPANRVIEMKGQPIAPAAAARVYWNPATRATHIDRGTLPPPPEGKQYQLWAIDAHGPVDAGLIAKDDAPGVQRMKDVAGAAAFAVTLEPEGGRATPTLDQMYVKGDAVTGLR